MVLFFLLILPLIYFLDENVKKFICRAMGNLAPKITKEYEDT